MHMLCGIQRARASRASALARRPRVGPYAAQHVGGRRRRNLSRFRSYDPSRLGTASAGAACNDALRQEHALARWPAANFVALGPRALRGFGIQHEVFALVGIRQRVFRSDGSVARGLSPCVGRSIELAELSTFAQTVPTGASVAVVIVGDAGARKSRLAWELSGSLRPDIGQVIQAEAVSYGRDIPYQLIGRVGPEGDRRFRGARSVGRCSRRSGRRAWRLLSRCG